MLDFIEKAADDEAARKCIEEFYSSTLDAFQNANNERLWLKTNIKLARLWLDQKDYTRLTDKIRELHKACQRPDGTDDPTKGTYSLEVYALEILMYAETRNNKRLKALYQRALKVRSAIPHPNIMGVIREAGGKMHMGEENWKEAQTDFFESFRNYDEAGSMQRIQVLKYLVLTTMLTGSDINPFESPETKAYQNDPRIQAMTKLVDAYQRDDVHQYEATLQSNQDVTDDPFIAENIEEVSRAMRTKGVLKLVSPYTRFTFAFVSKRLKISEQEAQDIIGHLILDGKLVAKIDQTRGTVEMERSADAERVEAVQQWTLALDKLWKTVLTSGDGFRVEDGGQMLGGTAARVGTPGEATEPMSFARGMAGAGEGRSGPKKRSVYAHVSCVTRIFSFFRQSTNTHEQKHEATLQG